MEDWECPVLLEGEHVSFVEVEFDTIFSPFLGILGCCNFLPPSLTMGCIEILHNKLGWRNSLINYACRTAFRGKK